WDSFNEGLLAYVLAIGSPTYPISPDSWDKIFRPVKNDTYIYLPQETLFVYQYPNIWIDFRDKEVKYANYFNNAEAATRYNWLFAVQNRFKYETYDMDIWGLSASDGPNGYKAYGAVDGNHDGTVAPYASISSIPFTYDLSMNAIRGMLSKYGPLVWGEYGFYSAFNVDEIWFSDQYIGIDQGDIILMIENYRTGMIWDLFMSNEHIQEALNKIGFIDKVSDYAVTPWYVDEYRRLLTSSEEKLALAPRLKQSIEIDGDLSEWKDIPRYSVTEDMNVPAGGIIPVDKRSQVLHSYFQATWDDENLYLAADVFDEYVVVNITPDDIGGYYRTDSIEFYINPNVAGSNAGLFKLAVLPFDTEGNVQAVRHEDSNPGPLSKTAPKVEVASSRTDYGYIIELKIPFEYLGITFPQPQLRLGFGYTIHNSNIKNAFIGEYVRENIISWNPLPDIWANPQNWGTLELTE
ncbi:MAG: glucoamylase family protein, partial [Defluviitoga tunisiensis]